MNVEIVRGWTDQIGHLPTDADCICICALGPTRFASHWTVPQPDCVQKAHWSGAIWRGGATGRGEESSRLENNMR
eukprot:8830613-Pyramimonas_sp.AAC.1